MTKSPQPECPECEKLVKVSVESQKLGLFVAWLKSRVVFAEWSDNFSGTIMDSDGHEEDFSETLVPAWKYRGDSGINNLLAEYFDIDLDKVEKERRALLEWIQEENS